MVKRIELTGHKFGRLTVKRYAGKDHRSRALWECICKCGKTKNVCGHSLRVGHTQSCGCLGRERRLKAITKHGCAQKNKYTPEYVAWRAMRGRCLDNKNAGYKYYGGRGIKICKKWGEFTKFLTDMGQKPSNKHSLERRNNDGNYTPNNCVWETHENQQKNKRIVSDVKCPNCCHVFDVMAKKP